LQFRLLVAFSVLLIFLVVARVNIFSEGILLAPGEGELPSIDLEIGEIIFYSIIVFVLVLIFIVIWVFIHEKNKDEIVGNKQ